MGLSHSPKIVTSGLVLALDSGNQKSYPGSGAVWGDHRSGIQDWPAAAVVCRPNSTISKTSRTAVKRTKGR